MLPAGAFPGLRKFFVRERDFFKVSLKRVIMPAWIMPLKPSSH